MEEKLYMYDHLPMRNKKFPTYDAIGHMVWQTNWISLKPLKIVSRLAGQIEGELHTHVPQALGIPECS